MIGSLSLSFAQSIKNAPYLNPKLSAQERVNDLMSRMTLEEKIAQMCQYVGLEHIKENEGKLTAEQIKKMDDRGFYPGFKVSDIENLIKDGQIGSMLHVVTAEEANYIQSLAMKSKLKIPVLIGIDAIHGNGLYNGATIYPSPISMAATFEDALNYDCGKQSAIEMRATGSHWAFTPNIDVLREPRWGRTGETYGEDPFLVGNMGTEMIKGFQQGDFTGNEKVIACAKHLIGGGESINGLNLAPTDVSERTLLEMHLPPYKKAVQEGKVFSVMAAHNEINGIPSHMDKHLMTEIMRDQWGFKGFYVSDWNDVERIFSVHHVAKDFKEAVLFSVDAGLDMNMHGPLFGKYVLELVNEGKLSVDRVNFACAKILEAKFKLGLFENPYVNLKNIDKKVFTKEHQATALEGARKAITLLKNDGILPLQSQYKKIFVVGPNANNQTTLGDWVKPQPEDRVTTVYEGLAALAKAKGHEVSYVAVSENSKKISDSEISQSVEAAKQSDVAVLVLGENSFRHDWANKTTGENIDRSTLQLSGRQLELFNAIKKTGKPVVVVYVSGSLISEPNIEKNANATIFGWEAGSFAGQAVAEAIFGDLNPGGKLPLTFPRSVGQLQMVYNYKPSQYFHKYHDLAKTPLYPFGYGLSYTSFEISAPKVTGTLSNDTDSVTVSVEVKNTGNVAGDEVVQLYIHDEISSVTRPVKELKGYQRVHLKAGESKTVTLQLNAESFGFYDLNFNYVVEPGDFTIFVGNSSDDKNLKKTNFTVSQKINLKK
ncbi:glycoside hydrolase family 3 N-terminal domain-containing protein [Flavobacterium sp. RSSA_27]|uniref:glycoside hydrolase family 3 N-terminal domain-containing protein n=1 Tax=Flavobacterium sp. RSSA_27 TaxID=3447667 RepID=UPI003F3E630D